MNQEHHHRYVADWKEVVTRQLAYVGTTHHGVILLADISGYTRLITQSAIEHAQAIMQYLFDTIYQATGDYFLVNEIEGDAIFAYCIDPTDPKRLLQETLEQIRDYGDAFERAKRDMLVRRAVDMQACPCDACSNIYKLSFKFIIHYGRFGLNQVGPFVKLIGSSVVAAHRLLKNDVPSDSYILMTAEALAHLPVDEQAKFRRATEHISHFGEVAIGYQLLEWGEERQYAGRVGHLAASPAKADATKKAAAGTQ